MARTKNVARKSTGGVAPSKAKVAPKKDVAPSKAKVDPKKDVSPLQVKIVTKKKKESPKQKSTELVKFSLLGDLIKVREILKSNKASKDEIIEAYLLVKEHGSVSVKKELSQNNYVVGYEAENKSPRERVKTPRGAKKGPSPRFAPKEDLKDVSESKMELPEVIKEILKQSPLPKAKSKAKVVVSKKKVATAKAKTKAKVAESKKKVEVVNTKKITKKVEVSKPKVKKISKK